MIRLNLYYLFLHLFLLRMIPLPLQSSGFTEGKLRVKNNVFHGRIVIIRHYIHLFFTNNMAIGHDNTKYFNVICFILFNVKYAIYTYIVNTSLSL